MTIKRRSDNMENEMLQMCFSTLQTAETLCNERDYYQRLYYDAEFERKDLLRQVDELKAEINHLKAERSE